MSAVLTDNPFVGLRPYEADDSLLFFGRRQQIAELLRRLGELRFLAVVGSSGCGKSSLVRAGLIPVLRAGFLVAERDEWLLATMKPGAAPLARLAHALVEIGARGDAQTLLAALHERGVDALLDALAAPAGSDANVLLLVDQFEEVFRFGRGAAASKARDEAADFVSLLIELAAQRVVPVYVILTMRSDFLGDCDAFPGLPEALNRGQYLVPRLSREQRRDAIEGPVRLYRQQISARLTDRLLNETFDTRDDLPVLQHALMRTWDRWRRESQGEIDVIHYEDIGAVREALSRDADAALSGLDEHALLLTKRLFQALTTVDSANRGIRRPARLFVVAQRCGAEPAQVWDIVARFRSGGRSFLVVSSEDIADDPVIDISHESLIRQWSLLGSWVQQERESIKVFRRLAESARLYREKRSGLYRDPDLQDALDWQAAESPNAAWAAELGEDFGAAMEFLQRSREARDEWRAEKEFDRRWKRLRVALLFAVLALFFAGFGVPQLRAQWDASQQVFVDYVKEHVKKVDEKVAADGPAGPAGVVTHDLDRVGQIAEVLSEMFRFAVHALLFFALTFAAKRLYRRVAYRKIRGLVARAAPPPRPPFRLATMLPRLKVAVPGVLERLAKWICIVTGALVLATCSTVGFASGVGTGLAMLLIGTVVAAALVGWVFAVARLNAELALLRARSDTRDARAAPAAAESAAAPAADAPPR